MDLHPIQPGINFWSNWVEIHWDYIVCLPGRIGYHLNGFTPNLTSNLCTVEFDRACNTGQNGWKFIENTLYASQVELGIIPMNSTGIYLNGFTPNSTGWISNSTGHEILVKMGVNSLRLHLYACLIELGIIQVISTQFEGGQILSSPVKFDQAWNTGQNGCKFTEITFVCLPNWIGYHPSDFHPIWGGVKFYPPRSNLTGH